MSLSFIHRRATKLLVGLLLVQSGVCSAQQLYSWKDKSGRKHYSDAPPADVNAKPVKNTALPDAGSSDAPPSTPAAAPAGKTMAEKELEFRQRRAQTAENEAKAKAEKEQKEQLAKQCEDARNYLKSYERGPVTKPNAKGGHDYLTDAERNKLIEDQRKQIKDNCSGI